MTAAEGATTRNPWLGASAWRRLFRDRPMIPLLVLLGVLVVVSELARPGIVSTNWAGTILRAAVPLAILAGCQTIAMLTGGIDLSVGAVASMTDSCWRRWSADRASLRASRSHSSSRRLPACHRGRCGVFRVHPLIITLGISLVVLGLAKRLSDVMVQRAAACRRPATTRDGNPHRRDPIQLRGVRAGAALILLGLRRTGYGGCSTPSATTTCRGTARRSAGLAGPHRPVCDLGRAAGIAGFLISGLTNVASVTWPTATSCHRSPPHRHRARRSWAAAAASGTSVGALILTVISALLTSLASRRPSARCCPGSIIVIVAAAYTRVTARPDGLRANPRPTSRPPSVLVSRWHEHQGGRRERDRVEWRVLDRDQVATPAADGPDVRHRAPLQVASRGDRPLPGRRVGRGRHPRLYGPRRGHHEVPRQHPGRMGRNRWPIRASALGLPVA